MRNYYLRIEASEVKLKEIFNRMTEAQKTIQDCLWELERLGVLKIEKEATGGNQ